MKARESCSRYVACRAVASAKAGAKRSPNVFGKRPPRVSQRRGYS